MAEAGVVVVAEGLVQVYAEVVGQVGHGGRPVWMADKQWLPYTEAVILETSRIACLVPVTGRIVSPGASINFGPYTLRVPTIHTPCIPGGFEGGDNVMLSIWSLHYDESVWSEPAVFRPERFLNAEGKVDRNIADLVFNFGLGFSIFLQYAAGQS